jgi:hypothetical protein
MSIHRSFDHGGMRSAFASRRARRLLAWVAALLLAAPAARSQGTGVVEGKLVNGTNPSIVGRGVDLDVVGLGGGMSILKTATTDGAGKFKIDGLPTDSPIIIRANYKSVNYHGRVNFDPSGKAVVEIEIFEPTTSMAGISVKNADMAFQLADDRLRLLETTTFENETKPPRSYMNMEGSLRFSKLAGILEPPKLNATGPGSAMPLMQSPLESADGKTYYSLFPLRPGQTTFEVEQALPYTDKKYTYRKKFYYDVAAFRIGVIPQDMVLSGDGLTKVQSDAQKNFSIYAGGPVKAGTEVVWNLSGGTPVVEPQEPPSGETSVKGMPTGVSRYAMIFGPLLLIGFLVVLWYGVNNLSVPGSSAQDSRTRELRDRRDQLLSYLANLDHQLEEKILDQREHRRQRDLGKRQLRRISLLLKK